MNILVTDGNSRAALAITRSLGARGHRLFVASPAATSLAASSRYCHRALCYPDPAQDRAAFIEAIGKLVQDHAIDVLLPVTDVCVLPIAEAMPVLGAQCRIPIPGYEMLQQAADKHGLLEIAGALGVPVPRSIPLGEPAECGQAVAGLGFPVVIKPARSRVKAGSGWLPTHVDYAASAEELRAKLAALPPEAFPVILQERIPGPGLGMFYCFDHGKPVASFAHRRIREKPPSGGISVLCESAPLHPLANDYSLKLLGHLGWHGVAMVEFKLDERDRVPKLMEINGRFWGSLQLAVNSGVDFPHLLLQLATGEPLAAPPQPYRIGVRSRWLWGEVDLLLMYLLKSRQALRLPAGHDGRLLSILKILNPYVRKQHLDVLRLSDPGPWLHECRQRLKG